MRNKLLLVLSFVVFTITIKAQSILDSGLVAYYPFTGNAGDSSINNNNTSFNNATLTADRFGNANNAYYFNGNGNYMLVPNHPTLNFYKTMSLCVWMKPMGYYQGLCYNNVILSKAITDNSWGNQGNYSLRFADYVNGCNTLRDSTKEYLYGPDGGVCLNKNIQTNRWYFVVFTTDGTTCKTFINGKLSHIGAHPSGLTFTNQYDLRIGMFGDTMNYPYYFKGVLDDIRIYKRSLSDNEVDMLYNVSPYPTVNGNVYVDVNNNGVMDSTDYFKPNTRINGSNGSFAITNLQGNYDLTYDTLGSFSTNIVTSSLHSATPATYNYNFVGYDTSVTGDYALQNTTTPFDSLTLSMIPLFNAARPGFDYPVGVTYTNNGNTFLNNATLTIPYDSSKLEYISCTNANVVDNGLYLSIPASSLAPGQHTSFMINYKLKTYAHLGDTLKLVATVNTATISAADSSFTIIRGSYDPNDKDATPLLTTTEVAQGKYINYIVRFENTGTDTAFKIIVTDELSTLLDLNSLQIVNLSSGCSIQVDDRLLKFTFNDVNLPYTSIDKIRSHGFIVFRVKPLATVTNGTDIPNKASIYFDYNLPIITNTAITKIRNPVVTPLKITHYELKIADKTEINNIWTTSNEINVSFFNIQRSFNGKDFETIGVTDAKNKSVNNYEFSDKKLPVLNKFQVLYYRIMAIDNDGKINYSKVKSVILNPLSSKAINVYPNPTSTEISISRTTEKDEWVNIVDIYGKVLKSVLLQSTQQKISVTDLPKGVYMLSFKNNETIKFIKE